MPARAGQIVVELTAGNRTFITDVEIAKTKLREFGTTAKEANAHAVTGVQATSGALRVLEGNMTNNLRASERFLANTLHLGPALQAVFPLVGAAAFAGILGELGTKVQDFFKDIEEAPARTATAFRGIFEPLQKGNDELQVTNDKLAAEIGKLSGHPGNGLQLALHEAWVVADKLEGAVSKTLKDLAEVQKKEGIGALNAFFTGRADTKGDEADIKKFTDSMTRIDAEGMASVRAAKTKDGANKAQDEWNKKALAALDEQIKKYGILADQSAKLQRLHDGTATPDEWAEHRRLNPPKTFNELYGVGIPNQSVLLNERQGTLSTLTGLRDRYALSADEASMQGKLPGLQASDEARKKQEAEDKKEQEAENRRSNENQADWSHLIEERAHAKEEFLSAMAKIDIQEQEAVRQEEEKARTAGEGLVGPTVVDPEKLKYLHDTFDAMRIAESAKEVKKFWDGVNAGRAKSMELAYKAEVEREKASDAADERVADVLLQSKKESLNRGAKTDEDLAKHSGITGVDLVNEEYQIRIKLATDLSKIEDERIAAEKDSNERKKLNAEKEAALAKATGEAEAEREKGLADLRQKDARDFFEEMRTQSETAGHILYTSLHSALDGTSDQLAKLVTGQKTDVGKTVKNIGEGVVRDSIKSEMSQGLGKLGSMLGIKAPKGGKPDFTAGNPGHVIVDNPAGGGSKPGTAGGLSGLADELAKGAGVAGGDGSGADQGSGAGGFLKTVGGLLGTVAKFGGFMAGGGDVDPGSSYIVGEHSWEVFTPRTAGSITPASKLGTSGPTYHIDARGADLGAGNRVARAIEAAHHAAVHQSLVANAERKSRTPKRS
jgi:hypothetical protein